MESVKHKIAAHKNSGTDVNIQFTPAEVEHLHHLTHTQHIQKESNGPVRSK